VSAVEVVGVTEYYGAPTGLAAAGAVFAFDSGIIRTVPDVLPISQAARPPADAVSSRPAFDTGPLSWRVIAVWALGGYVVLAATTARREL
jgi:hypothetical protein